MGEREPVQVQSVVEETLELLAASLPADVRLERRLDAADLAVVGDATQFHQVVMNLCTNAVYTEELFKTEKSQRFGAIRKVATRKLTMLEAATVLEDLKSPPGNRLEALVSDRAGQHSIRVNDQFRICFVWTDTGPTDVEITNHYA
jgi:proteic killer suppression protein